MSRPTTFGFFILLLISCSVSPASDQTADNSLKTIEHTETENNSPSPTSIPSQTKTPTLHLIPSPISTSTPKPIPTEIPIPTLEGLSIPIPDSKITNPELFDLSNQNSPISQFVTGMGMVGYDLDPEQIANNLVYSENKSDGTPYVDVNGNPFVIAAADIDPDPSAQGELFENQPLFIWSQENGWKDANFAEAGNIKGFKIGTQLSTPRIEKNFGLDAFNHVDDLVLKNFDHIILESLSWIYTEQHENDFYQGRADKAIDLANKNDIQSIEGDDLIFHRQIFKYTYLKDYEANAKKNGLSPEQMKEELTLKIINHITQVVNHNKDKVNRWSTVNEYHASNQDLFYKLIGPEYVKIAFQAARDADPGALLFYNNFDNETRSSVNYKQDLDMVKTLAAEGLVDAIGLQMHLSGSKPPSKNELIETMKSYGIPVIVSSYDLNMKDVSGLDEYRFMRQAEITKDVIEACIESNVCQDFYFWDGYGDKFSWKEDPTRGNISPKADPTPFTDEGFRKPMYYAIVSAILNQ